MRVVCVRTSCRRDFAGTKLLTGALFRKRAGNLGADDIAKPNQQPPTETRREFRVTLHVSLLRVTRRTLEAFFFII